MRIFIEEIVGRGDLDDVPLLVVDVDWKCTVLQTLLTCQAIAIFGRSLESITWPAEGFDREARATC